MMLVVVNVRVKAEENEDCRDDLNLYFLEWFFQFQNFNWERR